MITVLLGFDAPVILRPKAGSRYGIVGEAYVHGLMSGEAILGSLPSGWRAQADRSQQGLMVQTFRHGTDDAVFEDPRLGLLSAENDSGDVVTHLDYDPRLLPEALEIRGVEIQTFQLC